MDASTGAPVGAPKKCHSKDNKECRCKHGAYRAAFKANSDCPTRGHSSTVLDVAFSPAGNTLTSGCDDKTVMIWS